MFTKSFLSADGICVEVGATSDRDVARVKQRGLRARLVLRVGNSRAVLSGADLIRLAWLVRDGIEATK